MGDVVRRPDSLLLQVGVIVSALLFLILHESIPVSLRAQVKVVPIFLMLVLALAVGGMGTYSRRIAYGLACCAIGDVCLELESGLPKGGALIPYFLLGLIWFFFGHCCYAWAFASTSRLDVTLLTFAPPLSYSTGVYCTLFRSLPDQLVVPVGAYSTVIAIMSALALSRCPAAQWSYYCGAGGAITFTVSDTVLGYNRFVNPLPHAKLSIMTTYYLGQYLIALSARDRPSPKRESSERERDPSRKQL